MFDLKFGFYAKRYLYVQILRSTGLRGGQHIMNLFFYCFDLLMGLISLRACSNHVTLYEHVLESQRMYKKYKAHPKNVYEHTYMPTLYIMYTQRDVVKKCNT